MKIKNVKKLSDYSHLNLYAVQYTDMVNQDRQWIFASRSKNSNPLNKNTLTPDAVVIVPFHEKYQKLVIIKEFRVPLGGYQYGFPAGLIDEGETIEQAGKRELFEETGLKVDRILKRSPGIFSSSGMTDESVSMLFVECKGEPSSEFNEASEDIEVMMVSVQQARDILHDDTIKFDVKTWIVMHMFAATGSV